MVPKDVVKLAFQFKEQREIPFNFDVSKEQAAELTYYYRGEHWRKMAPRYTYLMAGVDAFYRLAETEKLPGAWREPGWAACGRWELRTAWRKRL